MSNCMTIADESTDQKDTCTEVAPKDVVEFILEEALLSVFIILDKDFSRIGDFNITDDFPQQYDRLSHLKDFEQTDHSQNQSASDQDLNLSFKENADRPGSLATVKENLDSIINSFSKKKEITKSSTDCTVLGEDVLADSELQIKNGQIHLEKNKTDKVISGSERLKYFDKKNIVKDENVEIDYYNEGRLNKMYVPLNPSGNSGVSCASEPEQGEQKNKESSEEREVKSIIRDESDKVDDKEVIERPFKPFTTEELRQVWENWNSSLVGSWDGDMLAQTEKAVRLMEELSSAQVLPDRFADPNRPRACALAEEDVKKIIKEIEEINFTQSRGHSDDFDVIYLPDGQGDADLESKSFTKSKDNMDKLHKDQKLQEEPYTNSASDSKFNDENKSKSIQEDPREEGFSSEEEISSQNNELSNHAYAINLDLREHPKASDNKISVSPDSELPAENTKDQNYLQCENAQEESLLKSSFLNENFTKIMSSLDQVLYPTFSKDSPSERIYETKENFSCASYLVPKDEINEKTKEFSETDSANLKEFQDDRNICEEFLPESGSLSGNVGSLSGCKQDEFTLKNLELSSELEKKTFQEKHSGIIKGSRSVNNTSEKTSEWNHSVQQGTVNLGKLKCASGETYNNRNLLSSAEEKHLKKLSADFEQTAKMTKEKAESNEPGNFFQQFSLYSEKQENNLETNHVEENSTLNTQQRNERLEETLIGCEKNKKTLEILEEKMRAAENEAFLRESQTLLNDSSSSHIQNALHSHDSSKSLNSAKETNGGEEKEPTSSAQSLAEIQDSKESSSENGFLENPEASDARTQKFKLHSQKMYFGADFNVDPAGEALNKFTLTESEETFIDLTESVIQIIEPPENSIDENYEKVTFSLLSEMPIQKFSPCDIKSEYEFSFEKNDLSKTETSTKKVYSGMSTIGPIKNIDYDPKDLTAPEIDFGKMTRITSSRQLAKDMHLFSSEVNAALSVKIIEEDDSDDDASLNTEEDHTERSSLVNRDIASLTKVQKVREVMSHQPKSEEDFEDEEALPRPRLDLKDVESMTDERYKVPDVSIPLLSFEIGDNDLEAGKELIESMGLVISGLTNPAYYEEEIEEDNAELQKNHSFIDSDSNKKIELPKNNVVNSQSLKILRTDDEKEKTSILSLREESKSKIGSSEENELDERILVVCSNSNEETRSAHPKYSTLGSVCKKASNKFMRKDEDLLSENSKSLPRDPSKMSTADSIRSILDDCQSSASSMLNKSRSFLKNTQSIFKSISQSKVTSNRDTDHNGSKKKLSPSESDVSTLEKKFPSFLKKEDFTKTKNLIKCKVEKTLRTLDTSISNVCKAEISSGKKDLRVVVRNEENLRVDRMENFKKLLPKSPLVYKSQFVKSQISFQSHPPESAEVGLDLAAANDQQNVEEMVNIIPVEDSSEISLGKETDFHAQSESKVGFQEKLHWVSNVEGLYSSIEQKSDSQQPDFIVMETIQGLPPADLESPSSEKETLNVEKNVKTKTKGEDDLKKMEASNSFQLFTDGACDVAPCFPEVDEEKIETKTPSERKIKTKKKKFTARFRNFWCSAFGKVKTTSKKGDRT